MESIASVQMLPLVEPSQTENYVLEKFSSDEDLYCQIATDFRRVGLAVKGIEHLKNHHCWMKYEDKKKQTEKRSPQADNFKLNETYLYHGTSADRTKLCEEGFDVNLSSDGCFGKGIYFSDTPKKCIKYTKNNVLLVARVILGTTKVYADWAKDKALVREPEKVNPGKEWRFYDSVKGRPRNETEYVVYRNELVLLEYLVEFTRTTDSSESSAAVVTNAEDVPTTVDEEQEVAPETPDQDDSDSSDSSDEECVNAVQAQDYTSSSSSSSDEEGGEVRDDGQDNDFDDDENESQPEDIESVIPFFTIREGNLTLDEKKAEYKRITQEEDDTEVSSMLTKTDEDLERAIYLFFAYKQVKEEDAKKEAGEFVEEPFEDDGSPIFTPIEPAYESDSWNELSEDKKKEKMDSMIAEFLAFTSLEECHRQIAVDYVSSAKYNLDTAVVKFYSSCF